MPVFPTRALLQINVTGLIKYQDVNGAMAQVIPMHLRTVRISQNSIVFIDDWEALIEWLETLEDAQTAREAFAELKAAKGNRRRAGWLDWKATRKKLG